MTQVYLNKSSRMKGINLIEMLVLLSILAGILAGINTGAEICSKYGGTWIKVCGGIAGGILGGAAVILALFLLVSFFSLIGMLMRMLEPANLVCRCQELGTPAPKHLIADTPIKQEAVAESYKLLKWPEFARTRNTEQMTDYNLRIQLAKGNFSEERIALAAILGDSASTAMGIPPIEPILRNKPYDKIPIDIQRVLRSGLPPRLCMVWALSCTERVLPIFEKEFHQDTRPRQAVGLSLMVLKDNNAKALEFCREWLYTFWYAKEAGCRVLHRSLKERMKGGRSSGEYAATVAYRLIRKVYDFVEPRCLWTNYSNDSMTNAYATSQARCDWSQPCYHAESIAYDASLAFSEPEVERQWQRDELIKLILNWEQWNEDRQDWQRRVDEEWIPKIQAELKGVRFKIPEYIELVRKQLVPWRNPNNRN